MRAIRVASAALLGVGALALCVPAALSNDGGDGGRDVTPFGFRITPSTVAAGGRVTLHLNRDDGCRGAATVTSGVFDTARIPEGRDSVTATVDRDVRSQASYRVMFNCDGASGSTELNILSGGSDGHGDGRADGNSDGRTDGHADGRTGGSTDGAADGREELDPQPLPPARGVQAGAGGSVGGFDLRELGLGAALVAGSVGTAYRISRRQAGEDSA